MKQNYKLYWQTAWIFICILLVAHLTANVEAQSNPTGIVSKPATDEMIASVRSDNFDAFDAIAQKLRIKQETLAKTLLDIVKDAKSSNFQQCAAAYYLGELHSPEASEVLAYKITLSYNGPVDHLSILMEIPAIEALVKIGIPAIPFLIRNIAESDSAKIRSLSSTTLNRIEGDKDIVRLRLQKALKEQSDAAKQARLHAAINAL